MKSLGEYIAESEREFSQPVRGDYFSINLREETLLETWVCDETPDGIVLHADERAMQLLEEYGYISQPGVAEEGISPTPGSRLDNLNKKTMASYGERLTSLNNKIKNETNPAKIRKLQDRIKQLEREYGIDEGVAEGLGDDTNDYYAGYYVDLLSQTQNMSVTDRVDTKLRIKRALESGELKLVDLKSEIRALDSEIVRTKKGVAEGSLNEGQYEMMMRNGQVKKFIAKDDADAKRIAAGHGAKSVIKLKGGVPAGKIAEQGMAEGHDYEADSDGTNVDVIDRGEYDFEGDQARDQLRTIVRAARRLNGIIDDDDNLPEWVQMKITKASDYIDTAADYMQDNKGQSMDEAKYQGREVPLGKPMKGDVKKSKVYVRGPKGNVVKVNFGQKGMKIKKNIPGRRKNFRARHNCDNPGPRWKARYWSCRAW
jgi:hypothetical protein